MTNTRGIAACFLAVRSALEETQEPTRTETLRDAAALWEAYRHWERLGMAERHNGWTNRETWAAHAVITNHPCVHEACEGLDGWAIAGNIRDLIDGANAEHRADILAEIGSLWRVDWEEIANVLQGGTP